MTAAAVKDRLVALSLLLLLCVGLSSCMSYGLPEYFSGLSAASVLHTQVKGNRNQIRTFSKRPQRSENYVLFVRPQYLSTEAGVSEKRGAVLGYQFLVGIIPFTRLYFQHGVQEQFLEILLDAAKEQDYQPLVTGETSLASVLDTFELPLVVRPRIKDVSLNAFDVLFFRVVSVSGDLVFEVLSPQQDDEGLSAHEVYGDISESEIKRYAFGPALSRFFRKSVREGVFAPLQEARYASKVFPAKDTSTANRETVGYVRPVILLHLPQLSLETPDVLGKALADSYGFRNMPSFSVDAVSRVIQRGIEQGLDDLQLESLSSFNPSGVSIPLVLGRPVWELTSKITAVATDGDEGFSVAEKIRVTAAFSLKERSGALSNTLLASVCQIETKRLGHFDGYWVKTLEQAMIQMIRALFTQVEDAKIKVVCRSYGPSQ